MRIRIVFGIADAFELGYSMHFEDPNLSTGEIFELLSSKLPQQVYPDGDLFGMTVLIDANGAEQDYVFEDRWYSTRYLTQHMTGLWAVMCRYFTPQM